MQMENKDKRLLFTSIGMGVAAVLLLYDTLFKTANPGLNVPVFIALFYAALFLHFKETLDLRQEQNWLLLLLIAAFSVMFSLYNNTLLLLLDFLMLLILLPLQIGIMTGKQTYLPYTAACAKDIRFSLFVRPFHKVKEALLRLFPSKDKVKQSKTWSGILLAIGIAVPLFGVLTILLASADRVFSRLLENIFSEQTVFDVIGCCFLFILVFLFFSSGVVSFQTVRKLPSAPKMRKNPKPGLVASYILLGAADLLLLAFSGIQIVYLFAGAGQLPAGITYSYYARTGFFQLCAAAVIVLSLSAVCMRFSQYAGKKGRLCLNILNTVLLACTFVLIVSSFLRLVLYEQVYLFTRLRLYVQAFLILLTLVGGFVIIKTWHPGFSIGKYIFFSTALCLLGLNLFNVDLFIGRKNSVDLDTTMDLTNQFIFDDPYYIHRYNSDPPSDLDYLLSLSADALPGYLEKLSPEDFTLQRSQPGILIALRASRFLQLVETVSGDYTGDIRYGNLSRDTVKKLLAEKQDVVEAARQTLQDFGNPYQ